MKELPVDRISKQHRSWNMSRIKCRDTNPELIVRSVLHRLGYRFRVHATDILGKPDIVLPKWHCIIFVHGCFWHRHKGCKFSYTPKSRLEFWTSKFSKNQMRDIEVKRKLRLMGWSVGIVWECQTNHPLKLAHRLDHFIQSRNKGRNNTPVFKRS